ncbi:serine/threonine-protein kinase [Streptomyces liangshanensis]|uniref:serine/threonine-protein kinase n=1 Tax=Streptomyces liangshanensis TaxID=2717324 RepID=UPI0036DBFE30
MSSSQWIGRYRVERRLGTGAFGVVWLAHDDRLQAPVAIKVMAENWAYRLDIRERFLSEARLLRRAASDGLVQVFDIGEHSEDRPYFVMEYADRGTLEDRLTAGPLPVAEALRLTAAATRGAAALHRAGAVHRDIKPSNVLVATAPDGGERVLVADLGLAKSLAQASGLTLTVGSAGYAAPEQLDQSDGIDARADVYSLGALLYHLLTGVVPGPPGKIVAPDRLRPGLPPEIRRAVLRALESDRERRWPTAAAFALELERLAGQAGAGAGRRRRRIGPVRLVAALTTLAVVALGTVAAVRWQADPAPPAVERVSDATGRIHVDVPTAWAGQLAGSGWTPKALGLPDHHSAGLTVAGDVARWPDLGSGVSGVFVGLGADRGLVDRVGTIGHRACRYEGSRTYTDASWHGRVRTWSSCGTAGRSLEEIGLTPVRDGAPQAYVQIRRGTGGDDPTDRILHSLRVSG